MTTQQDSVDVERLRAIVSTVLYRSVLHGTAAEVNAATDEIVAALSLAITQRDEQAKTYDDGVEDAAKIAEGHYADFRCAAPYKIAGRSIATAIRRLSIEQGDQDGGAA